MREREMGGPDHVTKLFSFINLIECSEYDGHVRMGMIAAPICYLDLCVPLRNRTKKK